MSVTQKIPFDELFLRVSKKPIDTILICPHCGDQYLHHEEVDIFNRAEDCKIGQHTHIPQSTSGGVQVRSHLEGNPSLRRHGLRIEFWCEICQGRFSLCIAQHKGGTYLHWERSVEPLPWDGPGARRQWLAFEE